MGATYPRKVQTFNTPFALSAPAHPDELPPGSEGASPPRPCELVEGTIVASCCSALSTVPRRHRRLIQR